jgi:hypothetical protein
MSSINIFEFFDAAGSATNEGVFLPVSSFFGLSAAELADTQAGHLKLGKAVLAILEKLYSVLSPTAFNKLGFTVSRANPTGAGNNLINQNFGATAQKLLNFNSDTIAMIPEPAVGANTGLGSFSIADIFPGAAVVAAADAVAAAGVVIPTALLIPYSSLTHAGLTISGTSDNRDWLAALFDFMGNELPLRSATQASAIVGTSASAIAASAIPANFTTLPDPISGIVVADLPTRGLASRSYSFTIQLLLNVVTQTFEVNSVVA